MRPFLIALMIVMLPLRGWVGDAMALSMAVGQAGTEHQAVAASAAPLPCHAGSADASPSLKSHQGQGMHDTQTAAGHGHLMCDLCNGPVLDNQWLWSLASSHPPQLQPPASEPFASQTARRDVRPPIS